MSEKVFLLKIGKRIKDLRIAKGLSQQELVAEIDYEKSNMSPLESGRINPKIATLKKIKRPILTCKYS
jgi:transcriptional regulator with XRE-family HTH domain